MLGFSIGPLIGGVLTHVTGCRAIFWLNALLMLLAIIGMALAALVFGLHALPDARASLPVVGPFVLAAAAFILLLFVEARVEAPLVDLNFFSRREFVMGLAIGSLSMFSIMSLLFYFNLFAQSTEGLGLTALEAGVSLAPLGVSLLALALLAPAVAGRFGLRNAMTGGMALVTIASILIDAAISRGGLTLLAIGFFAMGAGLALPYASALRLALSALPSLRSGQGSGIIACTFLGGSCGVAGGAVALAFDGFVAVLAMIALAGMIGAVLSRWIPKPD
jgi:predicted MFS family arabinose efflux permease